MSRTSGSKFFMGAALAVLITACDMGPSFDCVHLPGTEPAAGGEITEVVQVTRFIVNIGENQDAINTVMNRYWGDNHRPASTSIGIVRLATDPRFLVEFEAVAVIPD